MSNGRFKNDNRANPELVIREILKETEKNIKSLTGKDIELTVREK